MSFMVTPFKRYQLLLRSLLGVVLLVIGILSSYDHLVVGYDPQSEGIVLYNQIFRNLHNASVVGSILGQPEKTCQHFPIYFYFFMYC